MTTDEQLAAIWALWDGAFALLPAGLAVAVILLAIHVAAIHGHRAVSIPALRTSAADHARAVAADRGHSGKAVSQRDARGF